MQPMNEQLLKKIFWVLCALIFVYMIVSVPLYGISGDEITQNTYGGFVWDYIKSFGANKAVLSDPYILKKELQYYGGFFDGFATMLMSIFHPKDPFLFRHYWTMMFGFTGILATGLLAKEMRGWLAAIVAVIFIFFTGRYFGEAFNNPKDAPFAATYVLALYAMVVWLKNLENPKWKHTILLGLAIALCLSIRIGGLLMAAYLVLFFAVAVWQRKLHKGKTFGKTILHLAVTGFIGYFVAILWWPYALEAPLSNPLDALTVMSSNPLGGLTIRMLYDGHMVSISPETLPSSYMLKWLWMGLPLYLLIGMAGALIGVVKMTKQFGRPDLWMVFFAVLFPILYILYKHSVIYDGLRHVMFVIPPVAVIAALFFVYVFESLANSSGKYAIAGIVLILIILPARFMFANHPNEYVYFNELEGGIKNAYGIYETDYYMNSIKQGYTWLLENELKKRSPNDTIVVATNCGEPMVEYAKVAPVKFYPMYSRFYQKNQKNWDYAIYYGRFLDREQLQHGYFPSSMAIHVITADGVPLCTILRNDPERNGFKGFTAMQQKDIPTATGYFKKAAAKYPDDMEIWNQLAEAYANSNNIDSAQYAIDKAMAISSIDMQTAFMAGQIAMFRKDFKKAEKIFSDLLEENPDNEQAAKALQMAQRGARGQ